MECEILEIYREITRNGGHEFKVFLFDGKQVLMKQASSEMKGIMKKGRFYKQDWVHVENRKDGIVFRLIDPKDCSYVSVNGREFNSDAYLTIRKDLELKNEKAKRCKTNRDPDSEVPTCSGMEDAVVDGYDMSGMVFLPFLNDTLPYSPLQIPVLNGNPVYSDGMFCGRYAVGSNEYMTVDEWYSRGTPSVPVIGRVGYKTRMASISHSRKYPYYFFILLTSLSNYLKVFVWGEDLPYSSMKVGDVIGVSMYKKKNPVDNVSVVEHNRFTEAVYFKCKEVSAKEIYEIRLEKKGEMPESMFDKVSGEVEYMSVLNRRYSGCLEEYYLIRIGDFRILLFYNSCRDFYKIEVGRYLEVTNLRVMERGGFKFYISTIYTQIEVGRLRICSNDGRDFGVVINLGMSSDEENEVDESSTATLRLDVFGAIGFIPDDFSCLEEMFARKRERINGKECEIERFMMPLDVTLEELSTRVEDIVLNESKKFLIEAVLVDVDFSNFIPDEVPVLNDGTSVSYSIGGVQVQQQPGYVKIRDRAELIIHLFNNFWTDECDLEHLYRLGGCTSMEEFRNMKGMKMKFVIDAFRASEDIVLFYLTKVFR